MYRTLKTAWIYSKWPTIATVVLHAFTVAAFSKCLFFLIFERYERFDAKTM